MTADESLPASDHAARYCKPRHLQGGLKGHAFFLRSNKNETDLSVNWLEYFSGTRKEQLAQVAKDCPLRMSEKGKFALLPVSRAMENQLTIKHKPTPTNASHAGIFGYPHDREAMRLLAFKLWRHVELEDLPRAISTPD